MSDLIAHSEFSVNGDVMKICVNYFFVFLIALLPIILTGNLTAAAPIPMLHVTELYQQSDVVAIGRLQAISTQKTTVIDWYGSQVSGRMMRGELKVDKVIKGEPSLASVFFAFFQSNDLSIFSSIRQGQYGMFFLKRSSSNTVSITSPYYPYIVAVADPVQTLSVGLQRVAEELAQVVNSPSTTFAEKTAAIKALETVKDPSVIPLLKATLSSPNEQLRLPVVSTLLKCGDTSQLEYAINVVLDPKSANQNQRLQLALSIESGVHDSNSLPLVAKLLKTPETPIRRAIAETIRSTKSEAAVDFLSSLLFDSDAEIRYIAVIGLAEITGQYEWGPAQDLFQNNERRYLDHWREWSKLRK